MNRLTIVSLLSLLLYGAPLDARVAQEPAVLTLEQAQRLAKTSNLGLQMAQERLTQAEALVDKAWVAVKPQWNAALSYTHYSTGMDLSMPNFDSLSMDPAACGGAPFCFSQYDHITIQKQDTLTASTVIAQPLLNARAFTAIRSAKVAYEISSLATENMEEVLEHNVEAAYLGALTSRKLLLIASHSSETLTEHLKVAKARLEAGDGSRMDLLRANIDLNRAEQDVKSAESGVKLAKEAIRLLTSYDEDFILVNPDLSGRRPMSLPALTGQALERRRDLVSSRMELHLAQTQEKDAWMRFVPTLSLTGMVTASNNKGFSDDTVNWNVGLTLTLPLYDGGLRYASLKEAQSRMREAALKIDDRRRAIESEIRQLWLAMDTAEARLGKASQSVDLAREQLRLAQASFQVGAASSLDVLDANSMLFVAEAGQAREELTLQLAVLRLQRASRMAPPGGGGLGTDR